MYQIINIKLNNIRVNPNISLRPKMISRAFNEREFIMTSFVHLDYASVHPGVERVEGLLTSASNLKHNVVRGFNAAASLASMLLAAFVAALLVVADQLIDTWADGHLMVAWVALWAVAFGAIALFAPAAKKAASGLTEALRDWNVRAAERRSEANYWETAKRDPRVMADLQAAINRAEIAGVVEPAKTVPSYLRFDPSEPNASLERMGAMMPAGKRYLMYV